jgi:glycine dehydrogenase subunit 1
MDFTPHTDAEVSEMLATIGVSSIDELFSAIPEMFKVQGRLNLPAAMTEPEVLSFMKALAARNRPTSDVTSFLGAGAYDHYVPTAVHHLVSRGEFLTAYTPYQPEVSQGTLQAQFEFQTMVADLLGMDVANASMYEGATALAEACLMAVRQTRRPRVLMSRAVHPEYRDVVRTYLGTDAVVEIPFDNTGATDPAALAAALDAESAVVVIQTPNFLGVVEDMAALAAAAHQAGAMAVATFTEPLAFGLIEAPGNLGADIAAGEGQSLGLPLSFGGPYVGLFAVKTPFVKSMPGRLIGRTVDSKGAQCYTLTLAAREQHIRRERASSNICTNQGLCALTVTVYLSLLGRTGFTSLARYNHLRAERLKKTLAGVPGVSIAFDGPTFNEFVIRLGRQASVVAERLVGEGILPGLDLGRTDLHMDDALLVAVTELRTDKDFQRLADALRS